MHLPDAVVQNVASQLLGQADNQAALVSVMAMCGVSQQWREVAQRVEGGCLHFDSMETCGRNVLGRPLTPTEAAFRKVSPQAKGAFFQAAARLLSGYTQAVFAGEGVTDVAMVEAALKVGDTLTSLTVKDAPSVTDASFNSMVILMRRLKSLHLANLPRVNGRFLTRLLERCPDLEELTLEGLPACGEAGGFDGAPMRKALKLRVLKVTGSRVDIGAAALLIRCPNLRSLTYDGQPTVLRVAAAFCPQLEEVNYTAGSHEDVGEALGCLAGARALRSLGLTPRNVALAPVHLHALGTLPLTELRLNSYVYNQQPTINRASVSHLDNEGVRALVDGICARVQAHPGDTGRPFRLSLCGATALTHDAVSALLRLPLLSELKIDGCFRINSMDKMRLVAKVKAGASASSSALPSSSSSSRAAAVANKGGRCAPNLAGMRAPRPRLLHGQA